MDSKASDETSAVLYVRLPTAMKTILDNLAADNGLTLAMVAEQVIARGLRGAYSGPLDAVAKLHAILDEMEATLDKIQKTSTYGMKGCMKDHPNLKYHGEKCTVCGFVVDNS